MPIYDGVLGLDESILNEFVTQVYQVVHDSLLTGSVAVNQPAFGVLSIGYDFASAPVVTLAPSALVMSVRRQQLADLETLDAEAQAAILSRASFDLRADDVVVTVDYSANNQPAPTVLHCSVAAGLEVVADTTNELDPRLVTLTIGVPGDPDLSDIVNKGLVPHLSDLIEQTFLKPIRIPPLGFGTVRLAAPVVETGDGRLLATTAILPATPDLAPLAGGWPSDVAFAGVDSAVLNAAIMTALAGRTFEGTWQRSYKVLFASITIIARYRATIADPDFAVVPGQDGQVRGTTVVNADVNLELHNVASFSATGRAVPTVRATAAVTAGNQITVRLDGVDDISFAFDFRNVPAVIDKFLSDIANGLGGSIAAAVTAGLGTLPAQPVIALPAISIGAGGRTLVISLAQPHVTTLATPEGENLLAVTGGADVKASLATHTVAGAEPALA